MQNIVWVNSLNDDAHLFRQSIDYGFSIHNAPRPIPGDKVLESNFRRGVFYAVAESDRFNVIYKKLDAWPVEVITNDEIVELLKTHAKIHSLGDRFEKCVGKHGPTGLKDLARSWLGMPFVVAR